MEIVGFRDYDGSPSSESFSLRADNSLSFGGQSSAGTVPTGMGKYVRVSTRSNISHTDNINGSGNINNIYNDNINYLLNGVDGFFNIGNSSEDINSNSYFEGKIRQILVFNDILSGENLEKIEGYLANKCFGLGENNPLASTHKYKNFFPMIGSIEASFSETIDGGGPDSNY